jgi:hypothetical protein
MMTIGTLSIVVLTCSLPPMFGTWIIAPLTLIDPPVTVYGSPLTMAISGILVVTMGVDMAPYPFAP